MFRTESSSTTSSSPTRARLLIVDRFSCVDALLEPRPPTPTTSPYSVSTTHERLAPVLRSPAWTIPGDTPIARLDLIPFHVSADFELLGPMPAAYLTAGTVRPAGGPRYRYSGERWDTLGMLTTVSIDVYLTLVRQVDGTVVRADTYRAHPEYQASALPYWRSHPA
jgi:hypothetical protein